MTIRARLTAWYVSIMFVSLLAMGILLHREFAPDPADHKSRRAVEDPADEGDFSEAIRIVLWCGLPAAVLAAGGGWWLVRRALAPVAELTQAAERITERNLSDPLPRTGNGDELDRLAQVLNSMNHRLGDSIKRIHEFTLHASHELKTPLTILRGETETALTEPGVPAGQRERLVSQLEELRRLTRIVDGLTFLARADAGQVALELKSVALDELVRDAFADAQVLAQPQQIQVELAACEKLSCFADAHRLRQVLLNLVDNAVKYNQPGGQITLSLLRRPDRAELLVSNTGPGIAPEMLPRVFDRFFRGDPSHHSAIEGCGLGLSIAQWIVVAHGGQIQMTSEPGRETRVSLWIPATTP